MSDEREAVQRGDSLPLLSREWPIKSSMEGVDLGVCCDSAWVVTDRPDCDVCLMVDQFHGFGGSHALLRMDAPEVKKLAHALLDAVTDRTGGGAS